MLSAKQLYFATWIERIGGFPIDGEECGLRSRWGAVRCCHTVVGSRVVLTGHSGLSSIDVDIEPFSHALVT
jgi:hypothetical protein